MDDTGDYDDLELKAELDNIAKTIDSIVKKVEVYEADFNKELAPEESDQ